MAVIFSVVDLTLSENIVLLSLNNIQAGFKEFSFYRDKHEVLL